MKKLALLALLTVLTAGAGIAQTTGDMGNTSTPGATYSTGVVVTNNPDSLVLRRDDGSAFTVLINDATVGAKKFAAGARVRVDFHTNEQGQAVADVIQGFAGDPAPVKPNVVMTQSPTPTTTLTPAPPPAPSTTYAPAPAQTSYDNDNDQLPATAGDSPAVALLGLLALAGAVALRASR